MDTMDGNVGADNSAAPLISTSYTTDNTRPTSEATVPSMRAQVPADSLKTPPSAVPIDPELEITASYNHGQHGSQNHARRSEDPDSMTEEKLGKKFAII